MCVQMWQDDLIRQGLPSFLSLRGTKIILQRGTFTRIPAHGPPLASRPGNWLGAAEPCSLNTHMHTNMHTLKPLNLICISLNLTTPFYIRTIPVSPPPGCGNLQFV